MSSKDDNFNYNLYPWKTQEEFIQFYETLFPNDKSLKQFSKNNNTNNNLDLFIESLLLDNLKK